MSMGRTDWGWSLWDCIREGVDQYSSAKALPILFSGFEIAPSFEVSEEGGLHGTPTEAFLS